jgi:hypothetical protein
VRANEFIDEAINRRDLLKGVAGAAALGATGLAKAGEYQDLETIKKNLTFGCLDSNNCNNAVMVCWVS